MTGADVLDRLDITEVWSALGGPNLRWGRGRAFWRETRDYNVSIDRAKKTWYDHARSEGGGVLDLVCHVAGGTRADALRWCAELAGVQLDNDAPRDPAGMFDPEAAQAWRRTLLANVERWLDYYSARLWDGPDPDRGPDPDDDPPQWLQDRVRDLTAGRTALRDCTLRQLGEVYLADRTASPHGAARLVRAGMDELDNAAFWTTVCVRLLEASDTRLEPGDAWEPYEVAA